MSQPTEPTTADHRQRLIAAIAVVVAREGYGGTKIQDIVREAKVSLRTFYAEFPNKEACFLALYEQLIENLLTLTAQAIRFDKPWRDVMADGFRAYLLALTASPRLTYAAVVELGSLSGHARTVRQDAMEKVTIMLCDLVDRGRAENPGIPSRSITPLMGRAVMGGVSEMIVDLVVRGHIDRLPELVDVATDVLWSVVTNVDDASTPDGAVDAGGHANHPKSGAADVPDPATGGVRR